MPGGKHFWSSLWIATKSAGLYERMAGGMARL